MELALVMNKNQKREIKIIPILIIFVIIALLVSAVLIIITPQKEKVIQSDFVTNNYNQTQSTFKKVTFTGGEITVPEIFKIYQINTTVNLGTVLASAIIRDYQLEAHEKLENYWIKDNYVLIKNTYDGRWSFDFSPKKNENRVTIVVDEAINKCFNFFSKYNVTSTLTAQKDNIIYLDGNLQQEKTDPKKATSLQIPLSYELDGYPVFYQNESNYPFFCKINNNYEIERITFKENLYVFELVKEIPSINLDQAVKNIKNGKASIINAQSQIVEAIDLNWINEAELQSVTIDYRFDENLKIAYPFYKFQTKLVNSAGINIQAEIITPAVASTIQK